MNRALKITFVLPRTGEWPSGGLRVVYEYANRLSRRGHVVSVVHPGRLTKEPARLDGAKNAVRYLLRKLDGRYKPDKWFKMDPNVRLLCVPSLAERFVPDGDAVIATAWETAEWVAEYPPSKGHGFYLIQHLETWSGSEERVYATWKLPLQKIVISKWLDETARSLGETATFIPYGMDTETFRIVTPPESRPGNQLMMLYHNNEWKGCAEGLEALSLVRDRDPEARAILFGVPPRPRTLPEWIEYHQSPTPTLLRELYNRAAIFVAPSRTEGWGLTGCEALLCGAALVATDIDGHREFAFHGQTALISPARTPVALANNILRLINDHELRSRLAKGGFDFVRQLTWDRAVTSLEAALTTKLSMSEERTIDVAG